MLENEFYQIFNEFLQKHKISPSSNIETIKNEWIPFLNITELHLESCICGHKIKHITYLFNIHNKHIVFMGSSCCKKYGLLEKHLENDLLSHILKTQISQHSFEKNENIVLLTNSLDFLMKEYIFEKFKLCTYKYSREMDENSYYFDVFKPLKKMEKDILELIEKYNFDLVQYYDEISQFLKEREIYYNEYSDSETNSEIMEKLEIIENEINGLLDIHDDGLCYISENQENLCENILSENLCENILSENLGEKIIQENLGEKMVQENLCENILSENLCENILSENLGEKIIPENLGEKIIPENLGENILPENLGEKMVQENLCENILQENLCENILSENLGEKMVQENLCENIIQENLCENIIQENLCENILSEKFEEKDFTLNLKIEENIQNELQNEKERLENEYDFYENCEIYYEEEPDKLKTISRFSHYSSYHWNSNINMKLLHYIIESNEKQMQELKKNLKTHIENIERLKQQVYEFKTLVKTSNL